MLGSTLAEKKKAGNRGFEKRNWPVIRILKMPWLCIHEARTREVDKLNDLIGCMASGSMSRNNRGLLALQSGLCDAKASDQAFQNIC